MKIIYKNLAISFCVIYITSCSNVSKVTNNYNSVIFFSSNNINTIDINKAYDRLVGTEQYKLQNSITQIMQRHKIQQGMFEPILGAYKSNTVTSDNTEGFITAPNQNLKIDDITDIAKELAIILNQDTTIVFVPDFNEPISKISVIFPPKSKYTIDMILSIINTKLPAKYNQAYSIYLEHSYAGINAKKVHKIEWLGHDLDIKLIKEAFPNYDIVSHKGKVLLIYQNGKIKSL